MIWSLPFRIIAGRLPRQYPKRCRSWHRWFITALRNAIWKSWQEIEKIVGVKYDRIHIIGGGSNAVYLNELTAKYTGVPVYAGPGEATAIGNILTQMIQSGEFADLKQARECVAKSFEIKIYQV